MPHNNPHSRFGLPILYLAIFLLSLAGLFAKLIPLDALSITQLRTCVAALGLAIFAMLQNPGDTHGCPFCLLGPPVVGDRVLSRW